MVIMELISRSSAAAAAEAWKLARSTGKAAWIAGTSLLVLGAPLIFMNELEAQLNEFEAMQTAGQRLLLGTGDS